METYQIVRFYQRGGRRIILYGLTLQEAQEHCNNLETSSRTCITSAGKRRTKKCGQWFDGYEKE